MFGYVQLVPHLNLRSSRVIGPLCSQLGTAAQLCQTEPHGAGGVQFVNGSGNGYGEEEDLTDDHIDTLMDRSTEDYSHP